MFSAFFVAVGPDSYRGAALPSLDCNGLIESAEMEREEIAFRKQQPQERQYNSISNGTVGVDAELTAVSAEIASIEPIAGDPELDRVIYKI